VGLGHDFLRHVERTRLLIHLLDGSGQSGRDPIADYEQINKELAEYSPDLATKPQLVVVNKSDMPETQENLPGLERYFGERNISLQLISAVAHQGTLKLMQLVARELQAMPLPVPSLNFDEENGVPILHLRGRDDNSFDVIQEAEGEFRVRGQKIERIIAMTNMTNEEALENLQLKFDRMGISAALRKAGVKGGDVVYFGKTDLVWQDE
jgi:GTP-binding protein